MEEEDVRNKADVKTISDELWVYNTYQTHVATQ